MKQQMQYQNTVSIAEADNRNIIKKDKYVKNVLDTESHQKNSNSFVERNNLRIFLTNCRQYSYLWHFQSGSLLLLHKPTRYKPD